MKNNYILLKISCKVLPLLFFLNISTLFAQQKEATIGPENGTLVIVGGGNVGPEIWSEFIKLAGGEKASIIVVPTALDDAAINNHDAIEAKLKELGVKTVTMLNTRDPKVANSEAFVRPLRSATGIWFEGGRQWRLADAYLNTLAEKEFKALLNRGGVIGGSSAGATIQGSFLFRGDTKGNEKLVGDHTEGFDFIHKTAIDQHILKRNRQFDMLGFIKTHPDLLGIGLDESTAIVVHQNTFRVIGVSYVAIYDYKRFEKDENHPDADEGRARPFYFLQKGQEFNLKTRTIAQQAINAKTGGQ